MKNLTFHCPAYTPTQTVKIENDITQRAEVNLFIKKEYENHPYLSGNKWWKLKYNLAQARQEGHTTLLTFGGAYSNHLYATAAAAQDAGFACIGIVRGERALPLNPTLSFAQSRGMQLHFVSRQQYREKTTEQFIQNLHHQLGNFYLIPEGGTNALAIQGCAEWALRLQEEIPFQYLCLPVGTGGTMAGMIRVLQNKNVLGFPVLKNGYFLNETIAQWTGENPGTWHLSNAYHFGGYGKITRELSQFITDFENAHAIPLDPVYTGKMMFGIFDLLQKGTFPPHSTMLALHTGGLQGRKSLLPDNRP